MACGDEKARFRAVLLDPELAAHARRARWRRSPGSTPSVARRRELRHAARRNPVSRLLSREAWRLLDAGLRARRWRAARPTARLVGDMLLGAHLAGAAIEASMLGAAHACANPLTARYGVAHGVAVGLMLPAVVALNAPAAAAPTAS